MKKVVFTGPECSGKSTLSTAIANKFNLPLIKEYAREYLNSLNREYDYSDLVKIAEKQLIAENKYLNQKNTTDLIICDTNLQVIKIWSQVKYGKCDSFILENQDQNAYYILCYPDFEWEYDPLRENKNNRMDLFKEYHQELIEQKQKFIISRGPYSERLSVISNEIIKMI